MIRRNEDYSIGSVCSDKESLLSTEKVIEDFRASFQENESEKCEFHQETDEFSAELVLACYGNCEGIGK